jgi:hypothetical protein
VPLNTYVLPYILNLGECLKKVAVDSRETILRGSVSDKLKEWNWCVGGKQSRSNHIFSVS